VTLINKAATKEAALSCLFSPVILFLNSLHLPRGYFMGYAKLLFIYAYCVYHLWHLHSAGVGQSVGIWGESGESGKSGNREIGESGNPGSPRNCHSLPVFIAPTKSQSAAVKICANLCANELCIWCWLTCKKGEWADLKIGSNPSSRWWDIAV